MSRPSWTVTAPLWMWHSFHMLTVSEDVSDEIADLAEGRSGGFGSVKVEVTCGGTTWQTSLFPSSEQAAYVLPMKAAVRKAEGLAAGQPATVTITAVHL
ncbi:DUF1905 domain-containing protein [Knoellia koreensis]|uniref:DUF1905 domain-containing protein n=1 Tax=Knoellia koreensis TaxID=2730921 RepID=A0A849H3S9_9MICO|nr:DUF1905 domain-containing protein [Knoellia sp. DB2414S]NNM44450.1 DUF1905 domain-containing protein [Knoellia sp. DB2414S]